MEEFVGDLLRKADLSIVTKKHVRTKYREHIGRDLASEEKDRVNKLVYEFVAQLSAEKKKSEKPSADTKSPGNKENVDGNNRKATKIVIKGQVVDRKKMQKPKAKPRTPKKSPKKPVDPSTLKQYPKRNRSPRIMFQDVMSAVMDSSDNEGSIQGDKTSSEEDGEDESEETSTTQKKELSQKVQELKNAREKKIQLSQEKKKKLFKGNRDKKCVRKICSDDEEENSGNNSDLNTPQKSATGSSHTSNASTPCKSDFSTPRSSNAGTPRSSNVGTPRSSNAGSPRSSYAGTPRTSNAGTPRSSNAGTPQSSNTGTPKSSADNTPQSSVAGTPYKSDASTPQSSPEKSAVIRAKRKHIFESDSESESDRKNIKRQKTDLSKKSKNKKQHEINSSSDSDSDDSLDVPLATKQKLLQAEVAMVRKDKASSGKNSKVVNKSNNVTTDNDIVMKKTAKKVSSNKRCVDSSDDSDQEGSGKPGVAKPTKPACKVVSDSDSDLSEIDSCKGSDEEGSSKNKLSDGKSVKQIKNKSIPDEKAALDSESSEDEVLSKTKAKLKKKSDVIPKKKKTASDDGISADSKHLKNLRRICQACGMFIRNDRELKGCETDKAKINRLKSILKDVGMEGRPSLKKAEEVRLQKEAAELSSQNIISNEPSLGKRKVLSKYSRRVKTPKKSPQKPVASNPFSRLKGIVDSENSDSD